MLNVTFNPKHKTAVKPLTLMVNTFDEEKAIETAYNEVARLGKWRYYSADDTTINKAEVLQCI